MYFAIISGLCASSASLFGKLSGIPIFQEFGILNIVYFALMLICNAFVWTFFIRALHSSDSTLSVTVASTASNYIFSAIYGIFIFNETTSIFWWTGLTLIFIGLILILKDQPEIIAVEQKEKEH